MKNTYLACSLGLVLFAAPALMAQGKSAANAQAAAAAPKGAHPKSKAESDALKALQKMKSDSATTGDQLDAAITSFVTQFPTSDYLGLVATYGLEFYQNPAHASYEKSLLYGEQAIKADPKNLYALTTLASIIPDQVTDTDLDRDQRLAEATTDANQAIQIAETTGSSINGQAFSDTAKHQVEATAYSALAGVANDKKDYPTVVTNYQKAIPFDDPPHQAQDYFYAARAQIAMQQYPAALASLDGAAKADPNDPTIQAAVASNRKVIAALQKAGH